MTSTEPPTPTAVKRVWFPAAMRLPGERRPRYNLKVFATDTGLYAYQTAPQPADAALVYWAPIDYDKTPQPTRRYSAGAGISIHTTHGDVLSITEQGGCGCQFRRLKNWRPDWYRAETAWSAQ